MKRNIFLIIYLFFANSCSSLPFMSDEADELEKLGEKESVQIKKVDPALDLKEKERDSDVSEQGVLDRFELKLARLWARVDELEEKNRKQKEKIKILEQGLLLGTVPQELKESLVKVEKEDHPEEMSLNQEKSVDQETKSTLKIIDNQSVTNEKLIEAMSNAKNMFRSGRYGKAFLAFSKIEKEFSTDQTQGEELFWLGRCWHKLREFQSAKQNLELFISKFPNSPLVASAKFHLGKVIMDMGLKELAIKQFQEIVKEHPYEGAAEAAKQVLSDYKHSL